jgi:hypothetical protein
MEASASRAALAVIIPKSIFVIIVRLRRAAPRGPLAARPVRGL